MEPKAPISFEREDEVPAHLVDLLNEVEATQASTPTPRFRNSKAALLGFIVGDALGVPVEFCPRASLENTPVTAMLGYGTYNLPPGTWSDDSSLMLCTLESLTEGFDLEDIGRQLVRWLYLGHWTPAGKVFGAGLCTQRAISRIRRGVPASKSGGESEFENGNGSLMRILPLAISTQGLSLKQRFTRVEQVSAITHAHAQSKITC